jgi:hypothetical protein
MKVLHWLLPAVIVALPASSALAGDAKRVRGGAGADAVAPLEGGGEDEGGRGLTCTAPLGCTSAHLHFGTKGDFLASQVEYDLYDFMSPGTATICAIDEPTVIVLAHAYDCIGQIGSVLFNLTKNGKTIRRFAEKEWPYTVFGDAPADPLQVKTRQLGNGAYTLKVTIKGPNGCVSRVQNYQFTISDC